jgi:L-ascorbate metabolism protein UlaG (beta-lactamase superfamily)
MNKGGTLDLGWISITMVDAIHSGSCPNDDHDFVPGGAPCGFVIRFNGNTIYHAGDTTVFGDMQLIDELYEPTFSMLPIGGHFTMGPREAAYALTKFLKHTKVVFPIHYLTFVPPLTGDVPQLRKELEKMKNKKVRIIDGYKFIGEEIEIPKE